MSVESDLSRLGSLVRQLQGALGGMSIAVGSKTLTWAGSTQFTNFPTVTHGLADTPTVVLATAMGSVSNGFPVVVTFSYTSSTFTLQAATHDSSTPTAGSTVDVAWLAVG